MKRNFLSFIVLISMLLGMVSSASAVSMPASPVVQQTNQLQTESVVARVYFTGQDDLNNLASRYDIMEVNRKQGYALVILSPEAYTSLQQAGYHLEIDESKTNLLNQPMAALPGQGPDSIPGYLCYRTVEETYATLEQLAADHEDIASLSDIGDSWDKFMLGGNPGYDIRALRLTNDDPLYGNANNKPTFFLMAEIHAREYATAETATRFAEYLVENYGSDPDITWLLNYFRIFIVTMTNPDGRKIAEAGNYWRKNVDNDDGCPYSDSWGTDLNRNYGFKWGCCGGSSGYSCDETYRGPSAASEPETQAIQNFVLSIFDDQRGPGDTEPAPADATGELITLHSAAGLVLWPWGWTATDAPNGPQLQTLGQHLAYFNGYTPQQSNDLYTTDGTTDDWSYGVLGVASFTFELAGEFFQPCSTFEATDWPDNRDALLYAFKTARRPYINPSGPVSVNVATSPVGVYPGEEVLITATANDNYFNDGDPQAIMTARYSIDSPSWFTDTVAIDMAASDGSFDEIIEDIQATIDTDGLSMGKHTIFVESKDAENNWGIIGSTFLYILEPGVSPVIEGYVRDAGTNLPLAARVKAGLFNTTTDPDTGYYSMTVISGTYDMTAEVVGYDPAYLDGINVEDYATIQQDFYLNPFCTFFSDDVENGNLGWTAQTPWAITTEASNSPTHSWTESPDGNYGNNRNTSLTSQAFDLTNISNVNLTFWHTYQTESGWDYGYVEYSLNGGSTWTTAASYSGSMAVWGKEELSLPSLGGHSNSKIRFRFYSDGYTVSDGWHIDDIAIIYRGPSCMPHVSPIAEFTSNSPVPLGQAMVFTNQTSGSEPITYTWDFGDGVGTSTDINPSYFYTDTGTYTVTLIATNTVSDSITHTVMVEPLAITSVDLTQVTTDTIYLGDAVDFSADLTPDNASKPYDYTIDLGDATVITGTSDMEPLLFSHTYTSGGSYTVQISVKNDVMNEPIADSLDVYVNYKIFLPLTTK